MLTGSVTLRDRSRGESVCLMVSDGGERTVSGKQGSMPVLSPVPGGKSTLPHGRGGLVIAVQSVTELERQHRSYIP